MRIDEFGYILLEDEEAIDRMGDAETVSEGVQADFVDTFADIADQLTEKFNDAQQTAAGLEGELERLLQPGNLAASDAIITTVECALFLVGQCDRSAVMRDGAETDRSAAAGGDFKSNFDKLTEYVADVENTSHSMRSAALRSRALKLSFWIRDDAAVSSADCMQRGERQTLGNDAHCSL